MVHIFDLPGEIIEAILIIVPLSSVAAFSQTCKAYRQLVYQPKDNHLWRTLFLTQNEYDNPKHSLGPNVKIQWDSLLQRWTAARLKLAKVPPEPSVEALNDLLDIINHAAPSPSQSVSLRTMAHVLQKSGILKEENGHYNPEAAASDEYTQLIYRLKVYTGWKAVAYTPEERLRARCFTYNLRHYHHLNDYGPFLTDGTCRVNWKHLFMVQEVLAMNIMDFMDNHQSEFPMDMKHIQPGSNTDENDWAGITGTWQVVFCFCDHRDLLAFNRLNASQKEPDLSIFEDETFEEAVRFLQFDLSLVEPRSYNREMPISACRRRPTLHFKGNIAGAQRVQGYVYVSRDNEVRWSFTSGDPGQTIWSTEAIHIGGTASPFGALGTWTTVFHDLDDPVGPMWLWKLSDTNN